MVIFEFTIPGTPVSANQRKKNTQAYQAWMSYIRQSAARAWQKRRAPSDDPIRVDIIYFYKSQTRHDVDNLIKPVLDALNQLVYTDDHHVMDIFCRKRRLGETFDLPSLSRDLLMLLDNHEDFLYVRIMTITDLKDLR